MAASPALMSDGDVPASSPAAHYEKSFMTAATEDDDRSISKMATVTPEPHEKQPRNKKRSGARAGGGAGDDGAGSSNVGKIRHLKKEDGEPLWRRDIQYDFLKAVFENDERVFTNSYEQGKIGKQCFADLYIDTMSRSSKTSKVLRDKLLSDRDAAKGMAMVCLLVNLGRMNTTLNFFPEMRAQLRTYHAIPSLQANQDPHAYKQLQDAPRLKSILKGGSDDRPEPTTLEDVKSRAVPRTNPVNLLFLLTAAASKVAELHFPPGREFHDLIMKTNLSSQSRARAFLWIMWFYLESDFTEEGCDENPFGQGVDYGVDVANQGVPRLVDLTEEQEARENQDTPDEKAFGEEKRLIRKKIVEADQQYMADSASKRGGRPRMLPAGGDETGPTTGILPRIRPNKNESDVDSVRSTPPPRGGLGGRSGLTGSTVRRGVGGLKYQYHMYEGSSPGGPTPEGSTYQRKARPPTAHQLAVERYREQHVNGILDRGILKAHHQIRKQRRKDGPIIRALNRLFDIHDPFEDSDDEDVAGGRVPPSNHPYREYGLGGLCQLKTEEDDFGEEVTSYAAAMRRANRRLMRWDAHVGEPLGVIAPIKRPRQPRQNGAGHNGQDDDAGQYGDKMDMDYDGASPFKGDAVDPQETEDEAEVLMRSHRGGLSGGGSSSRRHQHIPRSNGVDRSTNDDDTPMDDADDLDDVDKELLGLAGGGDDPEEEEEEELDDVDKTLLGMDGDSDSD